MGKDKPMTVRFGRGVQSGHGGREGMLKLSGGRTIALSGLYPSLREQNSKWMQARTGCHERIDRRIPETAKWAKSSRAHGAIKH